MVIRYMTAVNKETHQRLQELGKLLVEKDYIPRNTKYYITKLALQTLIRFSEIQGLGKEK